MSNFKLDGRAIAVIVLLIIAAVVFLPQILGGGGLFGGGEEPAEEIADPRDTTIEDDGIELGRVVTATNLDRDGCATDVVSTFPANTDVIYVVAEDSEVPRDTEVFVRFFYEDELYEELEPIVADQDYEDTCIAFTLEPDQIAQLRPGDYEAEFVINGNPANTVAFEVQ